MQHQAQLSLLAYDAPVAAPSLPTPLPKEVIQGMADLLLQLAITSPAPDGAPHEETDEVLR